MHFILLTRASSNDSVRMLNCTVQTNNLSISIQVDFSLIRSGEIKLHKIVLVEMQFSQSEKKMNEIKANGHSNVYAKILNCAQNGYCHCVSNSGN